MKPTIIFWIILLVVAAFAIGMHFERTRQLQSDVAGLDERVKQLETVHVRREERWGWLRRIGSKIPVLKNLIGD